MNRERLPGVKPRKKGLFIVLLLALVWTYPALGGIILTEGFENNLANWVTAYKGSTISISSDHAVAGSHSLKLHYSDLEVGGGPWIQRTFPEMHHYFIKYHIRFSPGFIRSNISTKWLYGPRPPQNSPGPGCLIVQIATQGPYFTCQGAKYDFPHGFYAIGFDKQNGYSTTGPISDDQWIEVEYEVDIGTLNKADGVMRYWKDGQLIGENTAVPLNVDGVKDFHDIAFYQERGIGDIYYDNVILSDKFIPFGQALPAAPFIIWSSDKLTASGGYAYSKTFTAENGVAPLTWGLASGSLPGGLTLNSATGVVSGKIACSGVSNFTLKVTDAKGVQATKAITFTATGSVPCNTKIEANRESQVVTPAYDNRRIKIEGMASGIKFQFSDAGTHSLSVYDLSGAKVWSQAGSGNAIWNHEGKIARGVYLVRVNQNGKSWSANYCNLK